MLSPVATPEFSAPSSAKSSAANWSSDSLRRPSASSLRSLNSNGPADQGPSSVRLKSTSSSSFSIPFGDVDIEPVTEDGVRHAPGKLQAKGYKTIEFSQKLLHIIFGLRVPTWSSTSAKQLSPDKLKISKVSGSLTNAVFFVSCPDIPTLKTLLLRIYGPSSSELISRPRELHTLHILSSKYHIGPRVYGTFENGRVEEFFNSDALTAMQLRDPIISKWIGARMAELHCVDIASIEYASAGTSGWEIASHRNIRNWLQPAKEVLYSSSVDEEYRNAFDFNEFVEEWSRYTAWLADWESIHGVSKRVFAHNDAQYGNLLRLKETKEDMPDHQKIIVVDFEYASPSPAAFDIANHFHEWTADYHGSTPHILNPSRYPSEQERYNFYKAYLEHAYLPLTTCALNDETDRNCTSPPSVSDRGRMDIKTDSHCLDSQVRVWSPASHAMWAVWGLIQAREDLELAAQAHANGTQPDEPEFDYLGYAQCRVEGFRREIRALGLQTV